MAMKAEADMESAANASGPVREIAPTGLMSDDLAGIRPAIARGPAEPQPGTASKAALDVVTLLGSCGPAGAIRLLVSASLQGFHRRGVPAGISPGSSIPVRGNHGPCRTGGLLRDHPGPGQRCVAGTGRQPGVLPGQRAQRMQGYGLGNPLIFSFRIGSQLIERTYRSNSCQCRLPSM